MSELFWQFCLKRPQDGEQAFSIGGGYLGEEGLQKLLKADHNCPHRSDVSIGVAFAFPLTQSAIIQDYSQVVSYRIVRCKNPVRAQMMGTADSTSTSSLDSRRVVSMAV